MQMNRRGFTAIMDAGFFIILIGLAVILLSQSGANTEQNEVQDITESCDIIFESKVRSTDFGYVGDERVMALFDLTAASLSLHDGKAEAYLKQMLNELYPWENSYGLKLTYGNSSAQINSITGDQIVKRTYAVGFGGTLEVMLSLNV